MQCKSIFFCLLAMAITAIGTAQSNKLHLLSYNIRNAKGMDNQIDYDRISAVLQKASAGVVALQELDSSTKRSGGVDVLAVLAEKTGMYSVYGPAINYGGGKYGVGILLKEKPLRHYSIALPGREEQRVLLVAECRNYVVFCTHFSLTEEDRLASVAIVNTEAAKFTKPVFLLGDLNAEPASTEIAQIKKKWQLLSGEEATFPAPQPVKCLDYIFSYTSKSYNAKAMVLNEPQASDHRPVLVEVDGAFQ